jgi:hypothetical protein
LSLERQWSDAMKNLVVAMAVAAAALMGGTAAHAASTGEAGQGARTSQATDIGARSKHRHAYRHHHRHHNHWRHGYYRPYYNSYGYYHRPYGYYHRPYGYYGGGPGVTFSFGTGRW